MVREERVWGMECSGENSEFGIKISPAPYFLLPAPFLKDLALTECCLGKKGRKDFAGWWEQMFVEQHC